MSTIINKYKDLTKINEKGFQNFRTCEHGKHGLVSITNAYNKNVIL